MLHVGNSKELRATFPKAFVNQLKTKDDVEVQNGRGAGVYEIWIENAAGASEKIGEFSVAN